MGRLEPGHPDFQDHPVFLGIDLLDVGKGHAGIGLCTLLPFLEFVFLGREGVCVDKGSFDPVGRVAQGHAADAFRIIDQLAAQKACCLFE